MNSSRLGGLAAAARCLMIRPALGADLPLWELYESTFKSAKYIDLTHAFEPVQPVWPGFGPAEFRPATAGRDLGGFAKAGEEFTDRKSVVSGKSVSVRVDLGGRRVIKKKTKTKKRAKKKCNKNKKTVR